MMKPTLAGSRCIPTARRRDSYRARRAVRLLLALILLTWSVAAVALEDARIDFGALQPGATDLAQLLMVETLTGYGNDWYVIPIDLPVGSLV